MGRWLDRLRSRTGKGSGEGVVKVAKAPFDTFATAPGGPFEEVSEVNTRQSVFSLDQYLTLLGDPRTIADPDLPPIPPPCFREHPDRAAAWAAWWTAVEAHWRRRGRR